MPLCGTAARGDSQSRGRWRTACRVKRAIWSARDCSSSSVLTKVVSCVAEEWAPYLIALVSSCSVMPLPALIGTTCNHMCLRSVSAGCGLGGSLLGLCGPLFSTHALKNHTVLALTASLSAD